MPRGGKMARNKGANFERLIVRMFREAFLGWIEQENIYRGATSQTSDANRESDVVVADRFKIECKHGERPNIYKAWEQVLAVRGDQTPLVVTRKNNGPVMVTMKLETFLRLAPKGGGE